MLHVLYVHKYMLVHMIHRYVCTLVASFTYLQVLHFKQDQYVMHNYVFPLGWLLYICIVALLAYLMLHIFSSVVAKALSTVSEKLNKSAISEFNAEEQFDMTTQSSRQSTQSNSSTTAESNSIIVHEPEELILQTQGSNQHNQLVESQDVTLNLTHLPQASNLQQFAMEQQHSLEESDSQNTSKKFEQPHSENIGHQQNVPQHIQTERKQDHQLTNSRLM